MFTRATATRVPRDKDDDHTPAPRVPRDTEDDYTHDMAAHRREFLREQTGASLEHVGRFSLDPGVLPGNVENFTGVAQVPIGVAGPLRINGEHARGEFYVPLATTEGSLVASYNRGMRVLSECGGVKTTVVEDNMQRAPVFIFDDALQAREFGAWIDQREEEIRAVAEATTRSGKLTYIGQYQVGPLLYLRVNFTTGDAAGQNMTAKATHAACEWMNANYPGGAEYRLTGAMDTDKKHSHVNMLLTRGKRVVAEAVIKNEVLERLMGVDTRSVYDYRQVHMVGGFLAGSASNTAHAANGITAMFIATGQDVANIAESHAAITYSRLLENGDYYWSVTLTSLIVGTYGGGTALPTQRECLELLGCYGTGKAKKLAESAPARPSPARSHSPPRSSPGPGSIATSASAVTAKRTRARTATAFRYPAGFIEAVAYAITPERAVCLKIWRSEGILVRRSSTFARRACLRSRRFTRTRRTVQLELLGCYGTGKAKKLAEICAGTTLAGEISLTSAVLAGTWVNSHERLGRNREEDPGANGHGLQAVR